MRKITGIFAALLLVFASCAGALTAAEPASGVPGGDQGGADSEPLPKPPACPVCGCLPGDGDISFDPGSHWYVCPVCGEVYGHEEHHGGEATCTECAECAVCGEKYGEPDPDNHVHTRVYGYKAASCVAEGATGVTVCDDCSQIVSQNEVIPKTDHVSDGNVYSDDDYHWYVCSVCAEPFGKGGHRGGEATCVHAAVCEECGKEYGDIDPDNHKNTQTYGYKAPSCTAEGFSGVTVCGDCSEVADFGKTLPKTDHTPDEVWHTDGASHWHVCTVCESNCFEGAHSGGEADCSHKAVCDICGGEYGDLDPDRHCGPTAVRNYVKPTQHKDGYSGDTYCTACGTLLEKGAVIPATGVPDKNEYLLDSNVTLKDDTAFKLGSVITLSVLEGGLDYDIAVESLHEHGKGRFILLGFEVIFDGEEAPPIWPVGCTFVMPEDFTANVSVYRVSDTGWLTELQSNPDPFRRSVDFEIFELGMYAVVDNTVGYGYKEYIPGDINGNEKIDPADYAMAKRSFLGTFELLPDMLERGDINKNGRMDAAEYAMIKRHVLGTFTIPGAEGK